jgi:hypothetical protein
MQCIPTSLFRRTQDTGICCGKYSMRRLGVFFAPLLLFFFFPLLLMWCWGPQACCTGCSAAAGGCGLPILLLLVSMLLVLGWVLLCCWMMHQLDSCSLASRATSGFLRINLSPAHRVHCRSPSRSGVLCAQLMAGYGEVVVLLVDGLKVWASSFTAVGPSCCHHERSPCRSITFRVWLFASAPSRLRLVVAVAPPANLTHTCFAPEPCHWSGDLTLGRCRLPLLLIHF